MIARMHGAAPLAAAAALLCIVALRPRARSTELADVRAPPHVYPFLGAACRSLLAVIHGARSARLTLGLQVAVASNAFPSYYGGSSSHPKVFTRYPTADAAGVQSLAAAQQGVQALAQSPECGSV